MGNYTAEQVAMAFRAGFIEAAKWPSVCTQDADSEAVYEAADAYAATLRQQAGRVDVSDELVERALGAAHADDTFPLGHEFTERDRHRMRAALTAALAQKTQGNIVVTRDEVGRIVAVTRQDDDGRVLRVIAENPQWIAQNTQGDGAPAACNVGGSWLWCKLMDWCKKRRVPPAEYNDLFDIAGEAHKLYHAERARVPAEMDPFASQPEGLNYADGWNACRESMLAAAPSQRAEVNRG